MKYIIIPIFKFIYFILGGFGWCVAYSIYFIWNLEGWDMREYRFDTDYLYDKIYKTPWDYLLNKSYQR